MSEPRHTCVICKKKRYEKKMTKVLVSSWACNCTSFFKNCCDDEEIIIGTEIINKILKLKKIGLKHFSKS